MDKTGCLYVVATPIGNLGDLSPRAAELLTRVDLILCEDTRHSGTLLARIGASAPKLSYHEHNEATRCEEVLGQLEAGKRVALISDAGTPAISDPGFRLIRACHGKGIPVSPIPGPSALLAALSASGLATDQFVFLGFPPKSSGRRRRFFEQAAAYPMTCVFYLSPHQAARDVAELLEIFGQREAVLARELTKLYEEIRFGTLRELAEGLAGQNPKGELVLMVAKAAGAEAPADVSEVLETLREAGLSGRDLAVALADQTGIARREAYRLALENRPGEADED